MNFKEEYKRSAESISPDREAINRMKSAVLAQIAAEPEKTAGIPEKKKQIPFKKIAYIGGAVAACAVVTIAAVTLLPMLSKTGNFVDESNSSTTAMFESADRSSDCGSGSNNIIGTLDGSTSNEPELGYTQATESTASAASTTTYSNIEYIAEDAVADDDSLITSNNADGSYYDHIYDAVSPDSLLPTEETPQPVVSCDVPKDVAGTESKDAATNGVSDNDTEDHLKETPEMGLENILNPAAPENETSEAVSGDSEYIGEVIETTAEENKSCVIVLTGKDWITYNGIPYYLDSEIKTAVCPQDGISALNAADRKNYIISVEDDTVYVFRESGEFLGAYRSR